MRKWISLLFSFFIMFSSVTNIYAFDEQIHMEWKSNNVGWWYVNADGTYPVNQWQKIKDVWYHFDQKGYMQTGWLKENNTWYYLDSSGAMTTRWKKIKDTWYYFNSSGSMATGWKKPDDTWYYFDSSGAMTTGWKKIKDTWYYFNSSGSMATGWKKLDDTWYYLKENGAMTTGWQMINNTWYYFDSSGTMTTGWLYLDKTYYLNSSGAMVTGIQTIDNVKYRFDSSGVYIGIADDGEWKKINNQWYYEKDGKYVTDWRKIDGKWYYFNSKGVMQTGWKFISGKWYYFDSSGAMRTGWLKDKQFWYYLNSSGAMVSDITVTINNKTYEFLSNGVMYDKDLVISEAKKLAGQTGECVAMAYELTKNSLGMGASTLIVEEDNICGKAHQVSKKEARAGDLIIYKNITEENEGFIAHVGVYLNGYTSFQGNWLQQDGSRKAVITDYRNSYYYDDPDYVTEFWRIDSVYPDYVFIEDE